MSGREEGICSYLTLTGLALPERAFLALSQNKSVSELSCLQIIKEPSGKVMRALKHLCFKIELRKVFHLGN